MIQRIIFVDYLRICAILCVILLHCFSQVLFIYQPVTDVYWWLGNLIASTTHWAVPVFIMVSGAIHLGKPYDRTHHFFQKKLLRVVVPLSVFIFLYAVFYHFFRGDSLQLLHIFNRLFFDQPYEHLYFLIVLIALFTITPTINWLILNHSSKILALYLFTLLITLFMPTTRFIGLFWLPYLSYYVAGYLLIKSKKQFTSSFYFFIIGCLIAHTMIGTALLTSHVIPNSDGFYLFGIQSPLTILLSMSIFGLFKNYFEENSAANTIPFKLSTVVFGVYLVHPFFLSLIEFSFSPHNSPGNLYVVERLFIFFITTTASILSVYLFRKVILNFRNSLGKKHQSLFVEEK